MVDDDIFSTVIRTLKHSPLDLEQVCWSDVYFASTLVDDIVSRQSNALLDEKDIAEEVRKSSLSEEEKNKVITNLWRASLANIAYDFIRVAEAHGPGSGGLSFEKTIYKGQTGLSLDFSTLFDALKEILKIVVERSMSTSEWFGNPNYIKERF